MVWFTTIDSENNIVRDSSLKDKSKPGGNKDLGSSLGSRG